MVYLYVYLDLLKEPSEQCPEKERYGCYKEIFPFFIPFSKKNPIGKIDQISTQRIHFNVRPYRYVSWFISPSNYSYKYHKQ